MAPPRTCECGECRKCKHREYMRAWYARPENTDRHRLTAKKSRSRRIEAVRAYDRMRGPAKNKREKELHPEKWRARRWLVNAVYNGRITRQPCEICGEDRAHAHHEDYSKPKDVRWLCPAHHGERHRRVSF